MSRADERVQTQREIIDWANAEAWRSVRLWAILKWGEEVQHRPVVNVHRAKLDSVWTRLVRHAETKMRGFGVDVAAWDKPEDQR